MKTTISELKKHDGKEVSLNGWVYNIRSIGKIWFLEGKVEELENM